MPPFLASNLFDNPWIALAFLAGGAVINWLSRRRAEKARKEQAETCAEPETVVGPPPTATIDPEIEKALRRLLGQEEPTPRVPAPPPMPPVIPPVVRWVAPRKAEPEPASDEGHAEDELAAPAGITRSMLLGAPPKVRRSRSGLAATLRNPRTAREAWVHAVVLGPPRGLEP